MTTADAAPLHVRLCACGNYTNHESGVCPRCREKSVGTIGVAPEPIFDRTLASRTTTGKQSATRTSKRERTEDEHAMQVELVSWCRTGEGFSLAPCLARIVAIPNGGTATRRAGGKLKAEGRSVGFPDLFLPVARGGYHGALLELKRFGEVPTAEQFEWLHVLEGEGYFTSWTDQLDAGKAWLLRYGQMPHSTENKG